MTNSNGRRRVPSRVAGRPARPARGSSIDNTAGYWSQSDWSGAGQSGSSCDSPASGGDTSPTSTDCGSY